MKIPDIKTLLKLIPQFKLDGHCIGPHWIINRKIELLNMKERGFECVYKSGYFFWMKPFPAFG